MNDPLRKIVSTEWDQPRRGHVHVLECGHRLEVGWERRTWGKSRRCHACARTAEALAGLADLAALIPEVEARLADTRLNGSDYRLGNLLVAARRLRSVLTNGPRRRRDE